MDFSDSEVEDYPSSPLYEEDEDYPSSPAIKSQDSDSNPKIIECLCGKTLLSLHQCFATKDCREPDVLYSKDCPCLKHKAIRDL